jgi:hypothetical protein
MQPLSFPPKRIFECFLYKYQAESMQEPIRSTVEKVLFRHGVVFVPPWWNENYSTVERDNLLL